MTCIHHIDYNVSVSECTILDDLCMVQLQIGAIINCAAKQCHTMTSLLGKLMIFDLNLRTGPPLSMQCAVESTYIHHTHNTVYLNPCRILQHKLERKCNLCKHSAWKSAAVL